MSAEIIDHDDDTDLFASGEAADWLLEYAPKPGSVIDCHVRFAYVKAPVAQNDKIVYVASLVLMNGIRFVEHDPTYTVQPGKRDIAQILRHLR